MVGGGVEGQAAAEGELLFLPTSFLLLEPSTMPSSPFLAISFLAQEALMHLADLESLLTHGPDCGGRSLVGLGM